MANFESCSWKPPLCHKLEKDYFAGGGICSDYLTRWDCGIYRLSHWRECVATISPGCLWNTLPEDCREVEFKNLQVVFIFTPHHQSYLVSSRPPLSSLSSLLSGRNHWVHDHNLGHRRQCQDERGHHKGVVDESDTYIIIFMLSFYLIICQQLSVGVSTPLSTTKSNTSPFGLDAKQ